jgi:hypothetical protein
MELAERLGKADERDKKLRQCLSEQVREFRAPSQTVFAW